MERLLLARHGESDYSARGLLNGDPAVAVGLTAAGEEQARELGRLLATDPLDLCVVTELPRTRATADLALAGRDVSRETWPELNDPTAGAFEGGRLDDYRRWAWTTGSHEPTPGGGESRLAAVHRFVGAFERLLARPERTILVVAHALPIAYVLLAREGTPPAPRVDLQVGYARPHSLTAGDLARATAVLATWSREPGW